MDGTIKKLVHAKGFGFIASCFGGEDIFFHCTKVVGGPSNFDLLVEGLAVGFDSVMGKKVKEAHNVFVSSSAEEETGEADQDGGILPDSFQFFMRKTMGKVAAMIAKNPRILAELEWRDLERVMREVFEKMGFDTILTRGSKDGGFDLALKLETGNQKYEFLVEVKHWMGSKKKVGKETLLGFLDVVVKRGKSESGVLLSSSGFTAELLSSITKIELHQLRIGDAEKIIHLCRHYVQLENGIWSQSSVNYAKIFD